ncbi:MAG TPA: glycoside hydrolase family 15 protein [Myxococcaceae bacterium]|nr:glycoside hydrolase family 15 protein [Myxococcaceae bacterium]
MPTPVIRPRRSVVTAGACALFVASLCSCGHSPPSPPSTSTPPKEVPPGAPGEHVGWAPANKDGFGTAKNRDSLVWFTLAHGELTEVYYPDLSTPAVRDLQFIVSDGATFAEREHVTEKGFGEAHHNRIPYTLDDATDHRVELLDPRSLTFRQVNTARSGKYRITKTYVTDPRRNTVLIDVVFESLTEQRLELYVLFDPALSNDGKDDTGLSADGTLWAFDANAASAVMARPAFEKVSSGYFGMSDGWVDLQQDRVMDWTYRHAPAGNVVQTAKTALDGKAAQKMTLAIGFGRRMEEASRDAFESLKAGFDQAAREYAETWHRYLETLQTPRSVAAEPLKTKYAVSLMVLAAGEDKLHPGAFIASPTMPWLWGRPPEWVAVSDAYHLVWPRDLYQVATAMDAAGDRDAAKRSVDFMFKVQQRPDGSFTQNTTVDGTVKWDSVQLDEVAFPIVLAYQTGHHDEALYRNHIKKAANYLVANGPRTRQERWENQDGFSPATIAAEIAGLVTAAQIARHHRDEASAAKYEETADRFARDVNGQTLAERGPLSDKPYYLRITKAGTPTSEEHYRVGDGGPSRRDQRLEVDMSFLELVRLGIKDARDPDVLNSLQVTDAALKVTTPNGDFWRRYPSCGYGETVEGGSWFVAPDDSRATIGRAWPIFAGERGEYALLAGQPATPYLISMANTANAGLMMPEQVWDNEPPSGKPGFVKGTGTYSATPLLWSHAQFVRLALSIDAGRPVEMLDVVACRYRTSACKR